MTQKERLVELIQNSVGGCARHWAETIANGLLANGVIVPPVNVGDEFYWIGSMEKRVKHFVTRQIEINLFDQKCTFWVETFEPETKYTFHFHDPEFGKEFFHSKEEAEAALKEREVK